MKEETIWTRIFDCLSDNKIEVYPPVSKKGECMHEYIVVKDDGSSRYQDYSSEAHYYTLLFYVPQQQYARLEQFKKEVKKVISEQLYPLLVPTGLETPSYYDDEYKAHMSSVQYRNIVRNKQL